MKQPKYNIGDHVQYLHEGVEVWTVYIMQINAIHQARGLEGSPREFWYADKNEGEAWDWIPESKLFPTKQALIESL